MDTESVLHMYNASSYFFLKNLGKKCSLYMTKYGAFMERFSGLGEDFVFSLYSQHPPRTLHTQRLHILHMSTLFTIPAQRAPNTADTLLQHCTSPALPPTAWPLTSHTILHQ